MSKIAINSMQIHLIYNQNHNSLYWLNPLHRYINDRVIDVLLTERKPINPVSLKPVASKFIDRRWVNEKRNCATSIHLNKIFKSHHEWNKFVCKWTIKSNQKKHCAADEHFFTINNQILWSAEMWMHTDGDCLNEIKWIFQNGPFHLLHCVIIII